MNFETNNICFFCMMQNFIIINLLTLKNIYFLKFFLYDAVHHIDSSVWYNLFTELHTSPPMNFAEVKITFSTSGVGTDELELSWVASVGTVGLEFSWVDFLNGLIFR